MAPIITPRLLELLAVEAAALEVEIGVDVAPVVSVTVLLVELGVAVLGATTLSPFRCQPKTVKVVLSGMTVDVLAWPDSRNHDSDCPAVRVDVHCQGNVAAKLTTLSP